MQFPKPRIAIKEPTDRITIKHESWRLSGRPARWLVQGTSLFSFFLSFFSCQDLWASWTRVWRQIFYPLDKSAAKKKYILSTELLLDAQGRELWRNLSGSLSSTHGWPSPAGRRRGRAEGRRGPAGGKMGFIRGGKRDSERRRQCAAEKQHRHDFFNWEGNFRNETMGKLGITAREKCVKQVVRLHRSAVNRLSECECSGSFSQKGAKVQRWTTASDDQRCQKYGYFW